MLMIIISLAVNFDLIVVHATHFYGGTVTWAPLNTNATNSTIPVMFTQSYQWRQSYSFSYCNQSYILNQSPKIPTNPVQLQCVTTPASSCGGYTSLSIAEYCTDFSTFIDSSSGQISIVENISAGSKFCVAFQSGSWIAVQTNCGTNGSCFNSVAQWSIGCCLDLSLRSGGVVNTPPVATVLSRTYPFEYPH